MQASNVYYDFKIDPSAWRFRSRVLSKRSGALGFYRPSFRLRNPHALSRGPTDTRLVISYADATFVVAALLARRRGMGYSLFVANSALDTRTHARAYEFTKHWMFKNAQRCLVTGLLQADYARHYAANVPISIIGNPVDVSRLVASDGDPAERRQELRAERGWLDRFVVGYVGRLAPEKDLASLVKAAALMHRGLRVTVAVAGRGPVELSLSTLAAELGVDVQFLGFLDGVPLGNFYRSLDAFCLPSTSEPWGLVVNEAMAMGLPLVLSDRVGSRTLIENGRSGLLFHVGDVVALSDLLTRLAQNGELRRYLGVAAAQAIQPHTLTAWAEAVVGALGEQPSQGVPSPAQT
jgi:glycosyltransferase involved in cell wall biosynthesis